MKVGDLVRIPTCTNARGEEPGQPCTCFFCCGKSSRIGVVTDVEVPRDPTVCPKIPRPCLMLVHGHSAKEKFRTQL